MCLFFWTAGETIVIWESEINPFFEKLIRCCVLSRLSDDKLPAETFWVVCQMTNLLHYRKNTAERAVSGSISSLKAIW